MKKPFFTSKREKTLGKSTNDFHKKSFEISENFRKNFCRNKLPQYTALFKSKRKQKGQMFLIGSIILLVSVILLRDAVNLYPVIDEKTYQDSIITEKTIRNIKSEFNYILGTAALKNQTSYFSNFSDYIRRDRYRTLYAVSLVNGTTRNFTVTIGNYFGGNINYTINSTDSTPQGYTGIMNDRSSASYTFNTSLTSGFVLLTLNYSIDNARNVEYIPLEIKNRNFAHGFFDIKSEPPLYIRSKHLFNWSW